MPKRKRAKNYSKLFLALGLILIISSISWNFYEKTVLSFNTLPREAPISHIEVKSNKPAQILIPTLNIDLGIKESVVTNNNWDINPDGASHLNISAKPGEGGKIVIYGHNKSKILGNLTRIKKGQTITLKDESGRDYNYQVKKTMIVNPSDVWILDPTDEETLVIYTCTGILDSKRFVVIAQPLG